MAISPCLCIRYVSFGDETTPKLTSASGGGGGRCDAPRWCRLVNVLAHASCDRRRRESGSAAGSVNDGDVKENGVSQ